MSIVALARADDAVMTTVYPAEDEEIVLHNPDMGWVLYENYPLDPRPGGSSTLVNLPAESFPETDAVALMFAWSDVETAPDHYDWTKVDHAYDYWRKRNKSIQLRMSTESLLWWTRATPPSGLGVPQYLLDHLAKSAIQTRTAEGIPYTVVDARDPYYLDRLDHFLAATRAHFDTNRPVTLIDLRGFGLWGEWHSGYQYPDLASRRAALTTLLDHWSAAFPDHYLALSFSYDPDGPAPDHAGPTDHFDPAFTKTYPDYLAYSAFDHALTKPNVTFRRDGVGGAVHPNERKLIADNSTSLKGPIMAEFLDGYAQSKKAGDQWLTWKLADALSLHPNYVNLLGYQSTDALAFTRERPDLVAKGLREMGYRLVPVKVRYPVTADTDDRVPVDITWTNRGAGRALRDYHLLLSLVDPAGRTRSTFDAGAVKTTRWLKGETHDLSERATWDAPAGRYTLHLALVDPATDRPIALPLPRRAPDGSYPVAPITLVPPTPR